MALSRETKDLIDAALAVRERRRKAADNLEGARKQEEQAIEMRQAEQTNYDDVSAELVEARAKVLAALAAELDSVDAVEPPVPIAAAAAAAAARHNRSR